MGDAAVQEFSLAGLRGATDHFCGRGALAAALPGLSAWVADRALFIVSTPRVVALHGPDLTALRAAAARCVEIEVPEGEEAKSVAHAGDLWRRLAAAGGRRDSRLVAFGGGSVGDLAGFVAATFVRGIEVAQLPTTLLAQVDAAIGGKTAVDLPEGKNLVGCFHLPRFVVAEAAWLATLPRALVRHGLVEVVKMAALLDPRLLAGVAEGLPRLLAGEPEALGPVVAAAGRLKAGVVERDPEERGERALLNFGHTLGHALESAGGYAGPAHGDAVAWGMRFALALARRRGWASDLEGPLLDLLRRLEIPPLPGLSTGEVLAALGRDKKGGEKGVRWVLPERLGRGRWGVEVAAEEVRDLLGPFLAAAGPEGAAGL